MAASNQSGHDFIKLNAEDLTLLKERSEYYRALTDFNGSDSLNILTYPTGSPFSKSCFISVINCLASNDELSKISSNFPLDDLFNVALFLCSEYLLNHVVFDLLETRTCITILGLVLNAFGENHTMTIEIIQFIMTILETNFDTVLFTFKQNKTKLRKMVKNAKNQNKKFYIESRIPDICLLCNDTINSNIMINNTIRIIQRKLKPMTCCGMVFHLNCIKKLFHENKYPRCPSCKIIFADGVIDIDLNNLDTKMTIRYLQNHNVHPLPYRVRSEIWNNIK